MKININDIEKVAVNNLRGGEGVVYMQKVNPTLEHTKMYARITIPQGSSIGVHTHLEDEEVIYVLEGNGKLIIDNCEYPISSGWISLCKKGRNHSIKNEASEPLIILAVVNVL